MTDSERFDRLPATAADRSVSDCPTREDVCTWWSERYGIPPATFDGFSFWERGNGKIWVARGTEPDPVAIQGLGMLALRTRGEHWKPTTNAVQRFGAAATRNVIALSPEEARAFVAGEDQELSWDGDWGYLIAALSVADQSVPLGVGLYVYGELRSTVPKGRRRELSPW